MTTGTILALHIADASGEAGLVAAGETLFTIDPFLTDADGRMTPNTVTPQEAMECILRRDQVWLCWQTRMEPGEDAEATGLLADILDKPTVAATWVPLMSSVATIYEGG